MQYDRRYSSKWDETSLLARKATGFRCCYPGCKNKAVAAHHAMYRYKGEAIAGREVPGLHVFPLCSTHHDDRLNPECAHHPQNWYQGALGGGRVDARQRTHYYKLLIQGWDEKTSRNCTHMKFIVQLLSGALCQR